MSTAKMVILTVDQHMHANIAVMTQLRADRDAKRTPGDEYDKFLASQIAIGTETLNALNATTVTATAVMSSNAARGTLDDLEGQNLSTVIMALNFMRHTFICGPFALVSDVVAGQVIANPDALNAALLFLESPK